MWFVESRDRLVKLECTQSHRHILTQIGIQTNLNCGVAIKRAVGRGGGWWPTDKLTDFGLHFEISKPFGHRSIPL
jgi:hypothetical protein